jgi:hypothetical protein
MAGRPVSTKDYYKVLLRLPPALQTQVEQCHALLQRQHGPKFTQTEALWHLLEAGCAAVKARLEGSETPAQTRIPISKISEIPGEDVSMPGYGFPEDEEVLTPQHNGAPQDTRGSAEARILEGEPTPGTAPKQGASSKPVLELSEDIVKIAEARAQYDKMSERTFAQLLFDRDIYRHQAKDGREVPIPHTTLREWLQRAREAGLL